MTQRMRLPLAGLALALVTLVLAGTPVGAVGGCQGGPGSITTYYGNSKSQIVGQYTAPCNGSPCTGWGQITSNYDLRFMVCAPPDSDPES